MNPLLLALLAQYSFNSSEDRFYRLKSGKNARIGVAAGGIVKTGYRMVRVGDRQYLEHRLVWLLFNGEMPTSGTEIDHINGIHADNRVENLRVMHYVEHGRIHPLIANGKLNQMGTKAALSPDSIAKMIATKALLKAQKEMA